MAHVSWRAGLTVVALVSVFSSRLSANRPFLLASPVEGAVYVLPFKEA